MQDVVVVPMTEAAFGSTFTIPSVVYFKAQVTETSVANKFTFFNIGKVGKSSAVDYSMACSIGSMVEAALLSAHFLRGSRLICDNKISAQSPS